MSGSKTIHPVLYRTFQFFVAVKSNLVVNSQFTAEDETLLNSILATPSQQQLFGNMFPNDRGHALAVARTLQQAGYTHPALMQAALLHDVGKSMGQPIIHRVLIVLLEAFWPAALQRLSAPGQASWWRRPFVIHAQHAAIGADWAKEAGCDLLAVNLIIRHQDVVSSTRSDNEEDKLLQALQWADNLN
jgi:hypothetical protein